MSDMELNQEQSSKLDELITLINLSKDGAIAFVLCNEPILRDKLYNEIGKRFDSSRTTIINLQLDETSSDLLNEIRRISSTNNNQVIFVYGIEKASKAVTASGKSAFLMKLNMMRDDFTTINQSVIIWSNEETLNKIAIEAPDFWSWRTTVFEFRMEKISKPPEKTERITESGFENLTIDELNERYKQYSELLDEYKKKNIVDNHKFADWYFKLGMICYLKGDYNEALEKFIKSMEIRIKLGDQRGMAQTLHQFGNIHFQHGNYQEAAKLYQQSLKMAKELGDKSSIANTLGHLGNIHLGQRNYQEAAKCYQQSLEITKELGDKNGIAKTLQALGNTHFLHGNYQESVRFYQQSLEITKELGDKSGIADIMHAMGMIHEKNDKNFPAALEKYLIARSIFTQLNSPQGKRVERYIARLKEKMGESAFNKVLEEIRRKHGT